MNNRLFTFRMNSRQGAVLWMMVTAFMVAILMSCSGDASKNKPVEAHESMTHTGKYTCPMHPNVLQDKPGKCPVCGMDLVIFEKSGSTNDLMLSKRQMKLANIKVAKVSKHAIGQAIVVNGKLITDEQQTSTINSFVPGRIEQLFVKEIGRNVKTGEPLYRLYSEMMLALQKEYLLAKAQHEAFGKSEKRYESFLQAAARKLELYGMSKNQIETLARSKSAQESVTFLSPKTGTVTAMSVVEGQSISEGTTLYQIDNLDKLWLDAELYPEETSWVKTGNRVQVRVTGYNSSPVEGVVSFLSPEYRANTQIARMRVVIDNKAGSFKSGMQAQVFLKHAERETLSVPVDAVIRMGNSSHVYVQSGNNTFQPRMVTTGLEDFEQVEILSGLMENEVIAISGAYLLYSEYILKKGGSPMQAHNHQP